MGEINNTESDLPLHTCLNVLLFLLDWLLCVLFSFVDLKLLPGWPQRTSRHSCGFKTRIGRAVSKVSSWPQKTGWLDRFSEVSWAIAWDRSSNPGLNTQDLKSRPLRIDQRCQMGCTGIRTHSLVFHFQPRYFTEYPLPRLTRPGQPY